MDISTPALIALAVVVVAAIVVVVLFWRRTRTEGLKKRFGPEYERAVRSEGDPRRAEAELAERARRVEKFTLRAVGDEDRRRFEERWEKTQARFVDDPPGAVSEGDALIGEVMQARGYPVADFDQRAADLSVDHAEVVQNYRAAREIAQRNRKGEATTEDLRQAFVHYRNLFRELLEEPVVVGGEVRHG